MREVAGAVGLAEGEPGVRSVLAVLARLGPVSIRRISRTSDLPVPIVASVCGELRKRSIVADVRPAQLTLEGRQLFAAGRLGRAPAATCPTCSGHGVIVPGEFAGLATALKRAAAAAPAPRLELDQCHCTVGTKLRRVLAINEADALVSRRILLLGDDDLTSLTVSKVVQVFGSESTVANLTVVDIDPRLLAFLESSLADAPFPVSCVLHDLREPLTPDLRGAFDTVLTDPPYTVAAARLFLSRTVDALDRPGGDVFFSFGSRRPGAGFQVQQAIGQMGFVIAGLLRDFNEYLGAGALGGSSHLYHLRATNALRPLVSGTLKGPLYTSDAVDCG